MKTTPHNLPTRQRLTPYLIVKGGERALAFYAAVFGAKERIRLAEPSGKIGHAELEIGDSLLMLADEHPDFGALSPVTVGGTPVSLQLYVEDVDATVALAVESGATLLRPITDEFYGDRTGVIVDPFGHRWHLSTQVAAISHEEMLSRWNEMLRGAQ
jgi:PhnB protein